MTIREFVQKYGERLLEKLFQCFSLLPYLDKGLRSCYNINQIMRN